MLSFFCFYSLRFMSLVYIFRVILNFFCHFVVGWFSGAICISSFCIGYYIVAGELP